VYSQYRKNFVKSILRKAITSESEIFVVDDQVGQPTSATDFVQKMYELIEGNVPKGTYNITNTGSVTWYGFAQEILRLCDLDPDRVKPINTDSLKTLAQRPKYSVLSDEKLRAVGIEAMQEWSQAIHRSINKIHQEVEAEIDL
jgi:dTDP-4-dehydrorhamnose reductase